MTTVKPSEIIEALYRMSLEHIAASEPSDDRACRRAIVRTTEMARVMMIGRDARRVREKLAEAFGSRGDMNDISPALAAAHDVLTAWSNPSSITQVDSDRYSVTSSDGTTCEFASPTGCTCDHKQYRRDGDCWHMKVVKAYLRVVYSKQSAEEIQTAYDKIKKEI